jgi:4-amino-4-deoxy-L-arabinose transferase
LIHAARRPSFWALALLAVVLAFGWLGSRGLGEPDETRYALVADEMRASGGWLVPTLHGAPHLTKPPLTYWSIALGQQLFGPNGWGSRLFLGVAFALTVLLVSAFGEDLWGEPRGRWAGAIYATTLTPFVAASLITTDTLLVLWETAALLGFWRSWRDASAPAGPAWRAAAWACLGAAFLTKGPPGLLPLLLVLVFRWLRPRGEPAPRILSLPGLAAFVVIGMPWYATIAAAYPGLAEHFFGHELYRRIFVGLERRHAEWLHPFVIYGPVLVAGSLPWLLLVLAAPRRLSRLARRVRWRASPRARLLAVWIVLPILLFSLASSRLYLYVLPVFPALALGATGACLRIGRGRFLGLARGGVVVLIALVALLGLRWAAARLPSHRDARQLAEPLTSVVTPGSDLVVVGRPLHGFGLELGALARVADRAAPPVGGPCVSREERALAPGHLEQLQRRRIFLADDDALERIEERLGRAAARAAVRCREPFGPTRTKAIVCDPIDPGPARRSVALLLDAARDGTELHALACRARRLSDQRRVSTLLVLSDPEATSTWRRTWLPPRLRELLWWLPRRDARLERIPPAGGRPATVSLGGLTLTVGPADGDAGRHRARVWDADGETLVEAGLSRTEPLLLLEWEPGGGGRAARVGPHGGLTVEARW